MEGGELPIKLTNSMSLPSIKHIYAPSSMSYKLLMPSGSPSSNHLRGSGSQKDIMKVHHMIANYKIDKTLLLAKQEKN